jgi:hypothetical protein
MPQPAPRTDGSRSDGENLDLLEARYGSRFLRQEAPAEKLPDVGMPALDAMRLVGEELLIEGSPCATWRHSSPRGWSPRRSG